MRVLNAGHCFERLWCIHVIKRAYCGSARASHHLSMLQVWDHVQHCQAVVHGFPKYPDIVAICNCVADFTAASATPQQ